MKINYSYSNASKMNISFEITENKFKEKRNDKIKFPEQKIFRINSLTFNNEKEKQEIYTKYDCIYSEKNNSLYLIFNENINYSEFTKDKLINIIDFSKSVGINFIYILICKKNTKYLNIVQDMSIVGFESEKNFPVFNIDGNIYKSLKMPIKDISQEIQQINFI